MVLIFLKNDQQLYFSKKINLKLPFLLVSQHPVTTEYEHAEKHFLNTLNAELSYQSVLENGQIAIYGPPIYGLAGGMTIGSTDNDVHQFLISNIYGFSCIYLQRSYIENFVGLTLSNISTNASTNGISTNYNFRTYSQKLGLYSKENSDRIRKLSTSRISLLKNQQHLKRIICKNI